MSSPNILALQTLPETQPRNLSEMLALPCTHTCGDSCRVTCVQITCRHGWTCASTTPVSVDPERQDQSRLLF